MGWDGLGLIGLERVTGLVKMLSLVGLGWVKSGLRRLCVVCATAETVANATTSSKSAPPGSHN